MELVSIDCHVANWQEALVVESGTNETDWDYRPIHPCDVKRNKIKILHLFASHIPKKFDQTMEISKRMQGLCLDTFKTTI